MGWIAPDAFQFTAPAGEGVETHAGTYTSWECADGVSGGYRAIGTIKFIRADGTEEEEKKFCEIGVVDNWRGRKWW